MKKIDFKTVLFMICGVMAFCPVFTGCSLDDPQPIPAEEAYLRAFIKQYGLISPTQDWNQAERASVTVVTEKAKEINVYVKCAGNYYRVAHYLDVEGTVEIPLDIPEGTKTLYILVDDVFYTATVGGTLDVKAEKHRAPASRTHQDSDILTLPDGWGWVSLNSTDYFDCTNNNNEVSGGNKLYIHNKGENNNLTTTATTVDNMSVGTSLYFVTMVPERSASNYLLKFKTSTATGATLRVRIFGWSGDILDQRIEITPQGSEVSLTGSNVEEHELFLSIPYFETGGIRGYQIAIEVEDVATANANVGSIGYFKLEQFHARDMAWLLVAEDLGATDDFDFNDMIIRIECVTTNTASVKVEGEYWQVVTDEENVVLGPASRSTSRAEKYTKLHITSMCAGGTLDSYLHFRLDNNNNDFILKPGTEDVDLTTAIPNDGDSIEWHSWFSYGLSGVKNNRYMINTGLNDANTKSATIIVPDEFSMTTYSQIFQDYDGEKDNINDAPYNINDFTYTAWSYGNNPNYKIRGFYITVGGPFVDKCERILGQPKAGAAPQIFLIPDIGYEGYWHWAKERVPLTSVYPRFAGWIKGNDTDWYMDKPTYSANTKEGVTVIPAYMSR